MCVFVIASFEFIKNAFATTDCIGLKPTIMLKISVLGLIVCSKLVVGSYSVLVVFGGDYVSHHNG